MTGISGICNDRRDQHLIVLSGPKKAPNGHTTIGDAYHPKFCKEYVSRTDKACWKEGCDDVETPENYELDNCEMP